MPVEEPLPSDLKDDVKMHPQETKSRHIASGAKAIPHTSFIL
jgi:hypothetical protein